MHQNSQDVWAGIAATTELWGWSVCHHLPQNTNLRAQLGFHLWLNTTQRGELCEEAIVTSQRLSSSVICFSRAKHYF